MQIPATVVVNAAGLGSRLGLDRPKALLEVDGRSLIAWQMSLLRDVEDVRVVVGYQAAEVTDAVFAVRPDAMVVLNHEYSSTGTAASLMRGAAGVSTLVVSVDCDLIVHPSDLADFVSSEGPALGVLPVQSEEPVLVRVTDGPDGLTARGFDRVRQPGDLEWSGLVSFDPTSSLLGPTRGHVFEMIEGTLPMPARLIRAREVDYPDEIGPMADWIRFLTSERVLR
ncbi:NTP transferase domain-containing protein [soil metagenome]